MCLSPALTQAYLVEPVHIAQQSSKYESFMRMGYNAFTLKQYPAALNNFKQALKISPGDRNAQTAIKNVEVYVNDLKGRAITFRFSNTGTPSNQFDGGVRRGCISQKALIALIPPTNPIFTTTDYPTLFFYVPKTSAPELQFSLLDEINDKIYQTTVTTPKNPGIVSLNLSAIKGLPPLEVGKDYQWYFSVVCDPENRAGDAVVGGEVRRVELEPVLTGELKKATPRDHVSLYAVNGIWYDALAALYQARQSSPNNSVLADEWADLLDSVGLNEIAKEPLLDCCLVNVNEWKKRLTPYPSSHQKQ